MTQPTLDSRDWARPSSEQDDRFREVQVAARTGRWGPETELLKVAAMRLARENGKVEVDTVVMKPHRAFYASTHASGGASRPQRWSRKQNWSGRSRLG